MNSIITLAKQLRYLVQPALRLGTVVPLRLLPLALILAFATIFVGRQTMGATVEALSQQQWMQRIQSALAVEDQESPRAEWKEGDEIRLIGKITDSKGQPIPGARVHIRLQYKDKDYVMAAGAKVDDSTGAFERELDLTSGPSQRPYDTVSLTAVAPGYNTSKEARLPTKKGDVSLNFQLEEGAPVEVILLDESGKPVPEAEVALRYFDLKVKHLSGKEGLASFRVPADQDLRFEVEAKGFRDARDIIRRFDQDGGQLKVTMKKGPPIRGIVYDAATGEPIEGAGVFLVNSVSISKHASRGQSFRVGQDDPLVRTEKDGSFAIYTLEDGWMHWLAIEKEGYLVGFSGEGDMRKHRRLDPSFATTPGNDPVEVRLIPKEELDVTILLPDGWLKNGETQVKIHYSHTYITGLRNGPSSSEGSRLYRKKVIVVDGALRFKIRPTMAAPLSIGLNTSGDLRKTIEGWTFGEPIVIDFRGKPIVTSADVEYVIHFRLPAGAPPPEGHLNVDYTDESHVSSEKRIPIVDGEAQFTIKQHLDGEVTFDSNGVVGYYFPAVRIPPPKLPPAEVIQHIIENPKAAGALNIKIQNTDPEAETRITVNRLPPFWLIGAEPRELWPEHRSFLLPPGETELLLTPIPFGLPLQLEISNANLFFKSKPIVLRENMALDEVKIHLPEGSTLAGIVLSPDGEPVAGTSVNLNLDDKISKDSFTAHYFGSRTDAEGHFRFERINFDIDGVFYLEVLNVAGAADFKTIIEPKEGDVTLQLPPGADLDLRVIDAITGDPITGLNTECNRVDLPEDRRFLSDSQVAPQTTDADGWAHFVDLPLEGAYNFRVWLPSPDGRSAFNLTQDLPPLENGKRSIVIKISR